MVSDTSVIDDEPAVAEACPLAGAIRKAVRLAIRIFGDRVEERHFSLSVARVGERIAERVDVLRTHKRGIRTTAGEEECYHHGQDHVHRPLQCHCNLLSSQSRSSVGHGRGGGGGGASTFSETSKLKSCQLKYIVLYVNDESDNCAWVCLIIQLSVRKVLCVLMFVVERGCFPVEITVGVYTNVQCQNMTSDV